jgi:hypothetical protein
VWPQIDVVLVFTNGEGRPNYKSKDNFFSEKYATLPARWRFGVKNRSFVGFSPGQDAPKPFFDPAAKVAP